MRRRYCRTAVVVESLIRGDASVPSSVREGGVNWVIFGQPDREPIRIQLMDRAIIL